MTIQVIFHGEEVEHLLTRLEIALSPVALAGFMGGVVGPFLLGRAKARFEDEGDDAVGQWAPLQDSTNQIRQQMGFPAAHPINVRTGELEQYVTSGGRAAAEPFGASVTIPDNTPMGELADKMITAQAGSTQPGYRPTPPRPVLNMSTTDLAVVLMQLSEYITEAGKGAI